MLLSERATIPFWWLQALSFWGLGYWNLGLFVNTPRELPNNPKPRELAAPLARGVSILRVITQYQEHHCAEAQLVWNGSHCLLLTSGL